MTYELGLEAVPVAYTSRGEPGLYAVPLAPADLCAPNGRWKVLRQPEGGRWVAGAFQEVAFPTPDVGYVWSMDGLLIKTEDGGHTWRFVRHDLPTRGANLAFPTPNIGYLTVRRVLLLRADGHPASYEANWELGTPQTLLHTADGGTSWDILTPLIDAPIPGHNRAFLPATSEYDASAMIAQLQPEQNALEASGRILGTLGYLREMAFPSTDVGYMLVSVDELAIPESHVLLRTFNSGQTWQVVLPREQLSSLRSYTWPMAFPLSDVGYVLLPEALLCTDDGGTTWDARARPRNVAISGIHFPTATTGYALAAKSANMSHGRSAEGNKVLLQTKDSGHSWNLTGQGPLQWPLACPSPEIVLEGGTPGVIRRSTDGGQTWQEVASGTPNAVLALACPDPETCYGVSLDATIVKSYDAGLSWQVLTTGLHALYYMLGEDLSNPQLAT